MKAERINILLIEDNPLDARFITELLKEVRFFHHHLSVAETVRGGLEHLQKNETDIILLDLNLPDSMGQQTFETIYNQHKEIPIILVSGLEDEDLSIDLIQLGAQDYIAKANVDVHALEKSIGYSLERNKINNRIKEELNNRLKAEEQLKFFAAILGHLNRQNEWQKLIRDILNEIKSFTGFDAVEIRLRHGEDYPYFVQSGFAEAFIKEENFLCAKSTDCSVRKDRYGLSVLECTCGVVLSGKTDASKPFFN